MKIYYKRRLLRWNLVFGLFWIILGVVSITNNPNNYLNYGYLIIGLIYITNYILKSKNQYLTIENGVITLNNFFPKSLVISNIKRIKKSSRHFILQTEKNEIRIEIKMISKNSLKDLKKIFKKLNLKRN